jgi:hypothetical protein
MGIEFLRNDLNATIPMGLKFHEDDDHLSRIENITYNDFGRDDYESKKLISNFMGTKGSHFSSLPFGFYENLMQEKPYDILSGWIFFMNSTIDFFVL